MIAVDKKRMQRGQSVIFFAALIPLFFLGLLIVVDFGNFLVMRSETKMLADSSALAAAGAFDLRQFADVQENVVNENWAKDRAQFVFDRTVAENRQLGYMNFTLINVTVRDNVATVTTTGWTPTYFTKYFGVYGYTARATSSARSAIGILEEE